VNFPSATNYECSKEKYNVSQPKKQDFAGDISPINSSQGMVKIYFNPM